ncbi:MAG: DUF6221 family protein [Actinomycetota bacterium]|nr:DUF6221 family protein [Actinomycetota bacterium]
MNDLADFLLSRIAEDEAVARAVLEVSVHDDRPAVKEWLGLANPRRMLVWSDARRRIVALHRSDGSCAGCGQPAPCPTLRLMSLPFADHPDFHEAWRP